MRLVTEAQGIGTPALLPQYSANTERILYIVMKILESAENYLETILILQNRIGNVR